MAFKFLRQIHILFEPKIITDPTSKNLERDQSLKLKTVRDFDRRGFVKFKRT